MGCFYEQFVSKSYGDKQKTIEGLTQMLIFVAIVVSAIKGIFFGILILLVYVGLVVASRKMFLEYEYELTEDELVISKIMNKKTRKVMGRLNIKEVIDVRDGKSEVKNGAKIVKASFDDGDLKQQMVYVNKDSKIIGYKLSMDKKMLANCGRLNGTVFRNI